MRDNEERLPDGDSSQEEIKEKVKKEQEAEERKQSQKNPLDLVTADQSEFVELPSRGRFYPEDSPLHNREEIEVTEMTAKEEDILSSKDLVRKGVALDRVINSILKDPMLNAEMLLSGDKDAVAIHARKSAYGPIYEVSMTCPICSNHEEVEYNLNEETQINYGGESELADVEYEGQSNTFYVELPNTGASVEFRLLTGRDASILRKEQKKRKKHNLTKNDEQRGARDDEMSLTSQMSKYIVSINNHNKRDTIREFVQRMPARDARFLRKVYKDVSPSEDMVTFFECSRCQFTDQQEVPPRAGFFWPD